MSRRRTALQRSQEEPKATVDFTRLAAIVLITGGVVLAAFAAYQLVAGALHAKALTALEQSANQLAGEGRRLLEAQRAKVAEISQAPELQRAIGEDEDARRAIGLALAGVDPDVGRILVLPRAVEVLKPAPWPEPDFAAIAAGIRAKAVGGLAGPVLSGSFDEGRLTWATPIGPVRAVDGEPPALLAVSFPLAPLVARLRSLHASGYLDLRVLQPRGGSNVLAFAGNAAGNPEAAPSVVIEPPLAVGYDRRRPFLLTMQPGSAGALLAVALLAAFAAFWWKFRPESGRRPPAEDSELERAPVLTELVDQELREAMDFTEEIQQTQGTVEPADVDPGIFRAYDIRGIVGKNLNPAVARLLGQAIGSEAQARGGTEVVVARDGRLSGPELTAALIEGITAAGVDVVDIGAVPTGVLYFATHHLETGSGVMVTGSHNPPEYNGFKIMLAGKPLAAEAIQDLYRRIAEGDLASGSGGVQETDILEEYVERIASDIQVEEPLKVVVDAGNGIAGVIAPQVLEEIGCEVVPLYCEVDGNFPNHHPDPSVPENLTPLIMAVEKLEADVGVALDGDGDRLGVVTRSGEIVYPDRILMLFAEDVLLRNPGATIIYDVKCTGHLPKVILRNGGSPLMWKTGHSLIKTKMQETGAALAGEMSGHFFFEERWYGFDDGVYAAARLLEILASAPEGAEEALARLPNSVSTPEIKIPMPEGEHFAFIERFREEATFEEARITTIDGVRADYDDGWGLVRCSNTTPCLVLRFDAEDESALARIQETFKAQMHRLRPDLEIPF